MMFDSPTNPQLQQVQQQLQRIQKQLEQIQEWIAEAKMLMQQIQVMQAPATAPQRGIMQ